MLGAEAELVWHKDTDLGGADAVILPGGFAHGDYLRTGAIARFSPIMAAVRAFADRGGPVLGICNGFQVLLEAGLLPGAMVRNSEIKFVSRQVPVRVEQTDTPFTAACAAGQILRLPIAHGEGNYFAEPDVLAELEANRQVIFRYMDDAGQPTAEGNPNGSVNNIAGICNQHAQRRRADAASRARLRGGAGQRRRQRRARVGRAGHGVRLRPLSA